MGCLKKLHGMITKDRKLSASCPVCGTAHNQTTPRDRESILYQYKFYEEHRRIPTWKDAMAHCEPDIQEQWQQALMEKGIKIE